MKNNSVAVAYRLALTLGLFSASLVPAQAQTIYKYRSASGAIEYSTTKPKDRPIIEELDAKSLANDERTMYSGKAATGSGAGGTGQADVEARLKRLNDSNTRIAQAEKNLQDAKAALQVGQEPLPGERTGTTSGFTRLNESYQARQSALQDAVQKAQQELDQAYRDRP
jgi:multidrug efflux pump subunit AcrA (membrane-fusion protein)